MPERLAAGERGRSIAAAVKCYEGNPMTDPLDFFAEQYAEARAKFQLAVAQTGGQLVSYVHPAATGPDGGTLAIDVGSFGPVAAPKALLVLSGTHGGEGYTGSAVQIALMRSGALGSVPADTRVVLLHAINPYGFAHWTRTTENNVDLNRNFIDFSGRLPRNDAYLEVHDAICPADWTDASGKVSLVERDLPGVWAGQRLAKLDEPGRFTLAAVTRLGAARVVESDLVGQEGDVLHFMVDGAALDALQARLSGADDALHH